MILPFTTDQLVIGLVGLGMVAKGILEHKAKAPPPSAPRVNDMCGMEHSGLRDYLTTKFEQVNSKLDDINRKIL